MFEKLSAVGKIIRWIFFNVIFPVISFTLDWWAYAEYARDGELNGLVAPHAKVKCAYLVICIFGSVIIIFRMMYEVCVGVRLYQLGWTSEEIWTQRDQSTGDDHGQSKYLCIFLPVRVFCLICSECRGGRRVSPHKSDTSPTSAFATEFDKSEYWIDKEGADTLAILFHNLPLRLLQQFALCRPRNIEQVVSAAVGASLAIKDIFSLMCKRLSCCCHGLKKRNSIVFVVRFILLLTTCAFGVLVTVDESEGLPDIYVYVHESSSALARQPVAKLCYSRTRQEQRSHLAFQLSDIAWSGGYATCIVPNLSERLCTNGTNDRCLLWEVKPTPTYFSLHLEKSSHRLYYRASVVHRNTCVPMAERTARKYNILVQHSRNNDDADPPPQLSLSELSDKAFSGRAKKHGRCVIHPPVRGNSSQVNISCNAERNVTAEICQILSKVSGAAGKRCEEFILPVEKKFDLNP